MKFTLLRFKCMVCDNQMAISDLKIYEDHTLHFIGDCQTCGSTVTIEGSVQELKDNAPATSEFDAAFLKKFHICEPPNEGAD